MTRRPGLRRPANQYTGHPHPNRVNRTLDNFGVDGDDVEEIGWLFHPDRERWTGWSAEAQEWIRRKFTPAQAEVWRDAGVSPDEAVGWRDTDWDPDVAIEWVIEWRSRFGDTRRCLTDANSYVDVGVSPRVAADMIDRGMSPSDADRLFTQEGLPQNSRWRRVTADIYRLGLWRGSQCDAADAEMWEDCGFGPDEADEWMSCGFLSSFEAQHYQSMGYRDPHDALVARLEMQERDPA